MCAWGGESVCVHGGVSVCVCMEGCIKMTGKQRGGVKMKGWEVEAQEEREAAETEVRTIGK